MKRFIKIKDICESRSGNTNGKDWVMTDIVASWQERSANGEYYEQSMIVTLSGYVNEPLVRAAMSQDKEFELTYYIEARKPRDRYFTSIRGFINREYMSNVNTRAF